MNGLADWSMFARFLLVLVSWVGVGLVVMAVMMKVRPEWYFDPKMENRPTGEKRKVGARFTTTCMSCAMSAYGLYQPIQEKDNGADIRAAVDDAVNRINAAWETEEDVTAPARVGWEELRKGDYGSTGGGFRAGVTVALWPGAILVLVGSAVARGAMSSATKDTVLRVEVEAELRAARKEIEDLLRTTR